MDLTIYVPLVLPVLAALAARPLAERLPPRTATWLLVVSAVTLAAASCAVLGLLAVAAALRLPVVDSVGGMSLRALDRIDPASVPLGAIAGGLLVAAGLAALRAAWLRVIAIVSEHRQAHRLLPVELMPGAGEAVIVADQAVDAYTVPGWPGRIVITSGMLDALDVAEREVLLAHERAHASARHFLFTAAARLAAAANPLLAPLAAAVGYSVERWADEQAAAAIGNRPLAARTVAKAALAAAAAPARRGASAAVLGAVHHAGAGRAGLVPRRVAALLQPPPKRGLILVALAVVVVAVSCLSTFEAASDLHSIIELAQAAAIS